MQTIWSAVTLAALWLSLAPGMAGAQAAPSAPAHDMPEMLARSGTLTLKVADYDQARQQVVQVALGQEARLLEARTLVNPQGRKNGWLQFRIASDRLPALLPALQQTGKLYAEKITSTDNQSQYEELARRVERLRQHEARLGAVLESPKHMRGSDILFLQERLFRASVDESLLSQQRVDLERSARMSTLQISLFEPATLPANVAASINLGRWFATGIGRAHGVLERAMARGATAGAYALVFAPIWTPALLLALLLVRWVWLQRRRLVAWSARLLIHLVRLIGAAVGWVRGVWDARHQPNAAFHSYE